MDNFLTLINYSSWALHFLVFFPIVGMLLVLAADEAKAKHIALGIALIEFVVSIPLWTGFSPATAAFQFGEVGAWVPDWGIGYRVGVVGVSVVVRLLTSFLTPLAVLGSYHDSPARPEQIFAMRWRLP